MERKIMVGIVRACNIHNKEYYNTELRKKRFELEGDDITEFYILRNKMINNGTYIKK